MLSTGKAASFHILSLSLFLDYFIISTPLAFGAIFMKKNK
jgi:hypothetical protein